jgi:GNAT superfamily N-acetyltransferase
MIRIKFVIASYEECKKDFIEFRNANRETKRDGTYFDWRYLERPNEQKPIIVWAETEQGVKIGALSLIPHHYLIYNMIADVGILGDISVAKEWRGKGIAQQMFKYLSGTEAAKQLSACLVLPNEAAARPLMKVDWRTISTMTRYVKLIDVEKRLRRPLRASWLSKPAAFVLNFVLKAMSFETYAGSGHGYKGAVVSEFDDRFDALWDDAKKDRKIIGVRNKQYLTWRYVNHPLVDYKIFTLTHNSQLYGYLVYHCHGDSCYVDDIFPLHDKSKYPHYLLSIFLRYVKTTNIADITLTMSGNSFVNFNLLKYGFIKRSSDWRIMVNVADNAKKEMLLNGAGWFLTTGDKDV